MPFMSSDGEKIHTGVLRMLVLDALDELSERGDTIAGKALAMIRQEAEAPEDALPRKRIPLSADFLRRNNLN